MAKQQTDDELNLRRKARRRLIGAVALTLAVVVVLPMVLDSEPKSTGNDINLSIPDPDKAGKFVPRVAIPEAAPVLPASAAVVAGSMPAAQKPDADKPVVVQSQSKNAIPGTIQPAPQKPAEPPSTAKPAMAESYVAQIGAYANADTAKQELKKLKKWGFRAYTEKIDDKVRVRVGPYPDRDKAEKAGKLLEKHGLHPVILSSK